MIIHHNVFAEDGENSAQSSTWQEDSASDDKRGSESSLQGGHKDKIPTVEEIQDVSTDQDQEELPSTERARPHSTAVLDPTPTLTDEQRDAMDKWVRQETAAKLSQNSARNGPAPVGGNTGSC